MSIIYLAGPMSNLPENNFPAFAECAKKLRAQGHLVVSPAEYSLDNGFDPSKTPEEQHFDMKAAWRWNITVLMGCTAIALMPGYEESKGALLEYQIAKRLGLKFIFL